MTVDAESIRADLKAHHDLSGELVATLRELGDVRALIAKGGAEIWAQTADLGVTERKAYVTHGSASLVAQAEELFADVEALRVELADIEFRVNTFVAGPSLDA